MSNKIIAIDGFSSTGKSSLAKSIAKKLSFIHIDTGAMYRAVTLFALQNDLINGEIDEKKLISKLNKINISFRLDNKTGERITYLNEKNVEKEIRSMKVSDWVSPIAKIPEVRDFLVNQQREMANLNGIVMDGRDIGSVVFPNATIKIFLTASPEVRAKRRFNEMRAKGDSKITYDEVLENVMKRDYIDTHREVAPLVKASDAVEINNDEMNQEETLEFALNEIEKAGLIN